MRRRATGVGHQRDDPPWMKRVVEWDVCRPRGRRHTGAGKPELEFDLAVLSTPDCCPGRISDLGARLLDFIDGAAAPTAQNMEASMEVLYQRCAGLDVHKDTVVCSVRITENGKVARQVRTFKTTTRELLALSEWLAAHGCTHVVMEATGVYWKPVWHILSDGSCELLLA